MSTEQKPRTSGRGAITDEQKREYAEAIKHALGMGYGPPMDGEEGRVPPAAMTVEDADDDAWDALYADVERTAKERAENAQAVSQRFAALPAISLFCQASGDVPTKPTKPGCDFSETPSDPTDETDELGVSSVLAVGVRGFFSKTAFARAVQSIITAPAPAPSD